MIVDFRRNPPSLPPLTIMNSTVTAVESFGFLGTTISQDLKWDSRIDNHLHQLEEVQPGTGASETVLLCHHWIRPLHSNNCLVQLSYQIWPQKTTGGSPDCWSYHWYNAPQSPRTVFIQSEKSLWTPHIQHIPSLNCYHLVDATELWAP